MSKEALTFPDLQQKTELLYCCKLTQKGKKIAAIFPDGSIVLATPGYVRAMFSDTELAGQFIWHCMLGKDAARVFSRFLIVSARSGQKVNGLKMEIKKTGFNVYGVFLDGKEQTQKQQSKKGQRTFC